MLLWMLRLEEVTCMSAVRRLPRAPLLGSLLFALATTACGLGGDDPQITQVRPMTATAGELLLVSGRTFAKADVVWINGQPATQVTWVNDRLLTAVVPPDLPTGAYPLEVRSIGGERDAVSLNVVGRRAAPLSTVPQPAPHPSDAPGQSVAAERTPIMPPPQAATTPHPSAPPTVRAVPPHQTPPAAPDVPVAGNTAQAQAQVNQTFAQVNATLAQLGLPPLPPPVISPTP
ncbi:MAG: IPT/TIG domain-containing protein [Chloroflexota bacterium]|nr:IPT/TIG domain-containing protein [Chloroflexota bacterium]